MSAADDAQSPVLLAGIADAAAWAARLRHLGQRVVATNGCFDLLHLGHVRYLREARALGDALLVGLNGDASVRTLKGAGRPLVAQEERAAMLLALRWVDAVVVFPEVTAEALMAAVRPAVYTKGGDYAGGPERGGARVDAARLPEAHVVATHGGEVVLLPYLPGHSTTDLIGRIRSLGSPDATG